LSIRYIGSFLALLLLTATLADAQPLDAHGHIAAGRAAYAQGAFDRAIESWTLAADTAERAGDRAAQIQALVYVGEGQAALGRYGQAAAALDRALKLADASPDRSNVPWILSRLGNVLIATGPADAAETTLRRALQMAREGGDAPLTIAVLNDLGNFLTIHRKSAEAVAAYQESVTLAARAGDAGQAMRGRVNLARAQRLAGDARGARQSLDTVLASAEALPPSRDASLLLISVGVGYRELRAGGRDAGNELLLRAGRSLSRAKDVAEQIGDRRTSSYATGYLGALYEDSGRYPEALQLTREAMFDAQQAQAPESLYRWQWQAGRLLYALGRPEEAVESYRRAIATLQSIRPELSAGRGGAPVPFRESVGRVYFEAVDLLLRQAAARRGREDITPYLVEARETVELFKAAELRDYFRDDCVDTALAKSTRLDVVSQSAVVIYPILMPDRTELLVSLPTGLKSIVVPVGEERLTQEVRQFRRRLEKRTTREYLPHAQQLYDWLIRPLAPDLADLKVDTLVFVPDGALRTIPMGALHDGKQFLISKYALGITPGLSLTDPRPIPRDHVKVLALGVTQAVHGFPALPNVEPELAALRTLYPSTVLIDKDFVVPAVEKLLREERYTIVHIASHGEVSGDSEQSFVLAFDGKLSVDRLDQFIGLFKYRDDPLELLTLSACDTAEGDDRAALGLAGVAIKAGARSALATLWEVNDEVSARLVIDFYQELRDPSVSRVGALRRAQLKLVEDPRYDHPGFWAPFLLINNWL